MLSSAREVKAPLSVLAAAASRTAGGAFTPTGGFCPGARMAEPAGGAAGGLPNTGVKLSRRGSKS